MSEKLVFSRRIAAELRKQGFRLLRTIPNHNNPKYDVYIFEDTEELNGAWEGTLNTIENYYSKQRRYENVSTESDHSKNPEAKI